MPRPDAKELFAGASKCLGARLVWWLQRAVIGAEHSLARVAQSEEVDLDLHESEAGERGVEGSG